MTLAAAMHLVVRRALQQRSHCALSRTRAASLPQRRHRSVNYLSPTPSSSCGASAIVVAARACHMRASSTPEGLFTKQLSFSAITSSSTLRDNDDVQSVFGSSTSPLRAVDAGPLPQDPSSRQRRRRRNRRHRSDPSSSPRAVAAAITARPSSPLSGTSTALHAGERTHSSDHSSPHGEAVKKSAKVVPALPPWEAAVYRHIRSGAWASALELLHDSLRASPASQGPSPQAQQDPESEPHSIAVDTAARRHVSVAERCVWVLLWTGHEAAAWRVWRWMQTTEAAQDFDAVCGGSAAATSPRLVLLLTLFLHFAGQEDGVGRQRTRDMLLLLEMSWRTTRQGMEERKAAQTCASSGDCAASHLGHEGESAGDAWVPAVVQWLRCLSADDGSPTQDCLAAFYRTAARRVVRAVNSHQSKETERAALLLLSVQLYNPAASLTSYNDALSSVKDSEEDAVVREALRKFAQLQQKATEADAAFSSTTVTSSRSTAAEEEQAEALISFSQRTHAAFSAAAQMLSQLPRGKAESTGKGKGASHWKALESSRLNTYRFWARHLLEETELPAGAWDDFQRALRIRDGCDTTASAAWLRRVHTATDSGDWVRALQLCLSAPTHTSENMRVPWLQRLRKGLTACEVASRTAGTAPWQGAMALWHYAQVHRRRDDSLSREYGRIFMLLATATRWSEALRCFHALPATSLDGFLVAQVCYALRASAERRDRAVLELWATWRCRVGDAVPPTPEMVVQLLKAMLHTSSFAPAGNANIKAEGDSSRLPSAPLSDSPAAVVASDVATELLIAAAATTEKEENERGQGGSVSSSSFSIPGSQVPLDWRRQRPLVQQILLDRWTGGWAEALQVALASEDVALVRLVAPHVPAAHSSTLYMDAVRRLRRGGVELTSAEQAALWAQWGSDSGGGGSWQRRAAEEEEENTAASRGSALFQSRDATEKVVRDAELLLDELLGEN